MSVWFRLVRFRSVRNKLASNFVGWTWLQSVSLPTLVHLVLVAQVSFLDVDMGSRLQSLFQFFLQFAQIYLNFVLIFHGNLLIHFSHCLPRQPHLIIVCQHIWICLLDVIKHPLCLVDYFGTPILSLFYRFGYVTDHHSQGIFHGKEGMFDEDGQEENG